MFPINSRYHEIEKAEFKMRDGRVIPYLRRRFVPQSEDFDLISEHVVGEDDRLDHIASNFLGDPELFWQLCDANNAVRPEELEVPGRKLKITLPAGIPGAQSA